MKIRQIKKTEYDRLADFLYQAIFLPPGTDPLPREVINKPEIYIYIDRFGEKSDCGVVAELDGKIVGAAWTRIIAAYGYIDDETPELAMSVLPEYRGKGIGTKMLKKLFELLCERGYRQTSLAVQKENPALRFYERMGYKVVRENTEDYIMVRDLAKERQSYGISMGLCLGTSIGCVMGMLNDNIGFWLPIGTAIGISLGSAWAAINKKQK